MWTSVRDITVKLCRLPWKEECSRTCSCMFKNYTYSHKTPTDTIHIWRAEQIASKSLPIFTIQDTKQELQASSEIKAVTPLLSWGWLLQSVCSQSKLIRIATERSTTSFHSLPSAHTTLLYPFIPLPQSKCSWNFMLNLVMNLSGAKSK